MSDLLGFWSYVHADDEVDLGRVQQLAHDIVGHYEALQAEQIRLFLDRDDLHWGDQWREQVDDALSNVAFFVPVITPRYFKRPECRRELQFFASKAEQLGITELIMPILYIRVPELEEEAPSDPLMQLVKRVQWQPWTTLRFADRSSPDYRMAVDGLAQELVRRVASVEASDVVGAATRVDAAAPDGAGDPGVLDRLAALEEAMPRWTDTMSGITAELHRIGEIMERGTQDMERGEKSGKGFAARLSVARHVARELQEPVGQIESLGQEFVADLSDIDAGIRTILEGVPEQLREQPGSLAEVCEFFDSIRSLSQAANGGLGAISQMLAASAGIEKMSKDMRAPMRKFRNSMTAMIEARDITDSWLALVNSSGLNCPPSADRPASLPAST